MAVKTPYSYLAGFDNGHDQPDHQPGNRPRPILRVLRLRNRFSDKIDAESQLLGGYRDIGIKMQVGFKMMPNGDLKFVPCCQWAEKSCKFKVSFCLLLQHLHLWRCFQKSNHCFAQIKFMVVELQLRVGKMIPADFKELHARYVQCRDLLSL